MDRKSFLKAGHTPTLLAAFLYFDLAFMVWVLLGPLGVQIAKDLALDHTQKGLMVATPVLAGALLRIVMGVLVDHLKPKKAGAIGQVIVIAALAVAWKFGIHSYTEVLTLGLVELHDEPHLLRRLGALALLVLLHVLASGADPRVEGVLADSEGLRRGTAEAAALHHGDELLDHLVGQRAARKVAFDLVAVHESSSFPANRGACSVRASGGLALARTPGGPPPSLVT